VAALGLIPALVILMQVVVVVELVVLANRLEATVSVATVVLEEPVISLEASYSTQEAVAAVSTTQRLREAQAA
jgi:hypothetical protein